MKIRLVDQRQGKEENFAFSGGVKGFVEYINRSKTVLHPNVFSVATESTAGGSLVGVEVAMHKRRVQRAGAVLYQQYSAATVVPT